MGGFFSRLFAPKSAGSSESEVAAAIAVALEMYRSESCPRAASAIVARASKTTSGWNSKSYGMTQLPQRNRKW